MESYHEDFHIDGDKISLYKFSIINGCQTTTMIGKHLQALKIFSGAK